MQITLVENALDFILSAVQYGQVNETRSLKYAVLHLSDGVELILKEKLSREHWSLLFADMKKADKDAFNSGDFVSVDFQDCVLRLGHISGVDLEPHSELLKKLRRTRNQLQHLRYSGTQDEVASVLVKTWSFVLDFIHDQLPDVVEVEVEIIDKIKDLIIKNQDFVTERLEAIKPEIDRFQKSSDAILQCPRCLQDSLLIPGGEDVRCVFCRYEASPEEAVYAWCSEIFGWDDPRDGGRATKFACPECNEETLVQQEYGDMSPPKPGWVCFSCGQTWGYSEIDFCDWCNEPYQTNGEDDIGTCEDCFQAQMEKD